MKPHRLGEVEWFLDDEKMITPLKSIVPTGGMKRGYFSFDHDGRKFFLKFFTEKGATGLLRNKMSPRGAKEYRSGKKLLDMSVLTPKPAGYGVSDRGSYIIQEWVTGDPFVDAFLGGGNRKDLLLKLADLLRTLKAHKVLHNDLHLNNVLVKNGDLYLIDLHKMEIKIQFSRKDESSNLSHAITMIYGNITEEEKTFFFDRYGAEDMKPTVEEEMKRLWERWIRKKQERAFDNTSMLSVRGDRVYMTGVDKIDDGEPVRLIKRDRKTTVEQYNDHIRKTYRNGRRLKKAWKNHVTLKYLDLSVTPEPYYVKTPTLFSKGYIAMEDLTGSGEEFDRYLDRRYDGMTKDVKAAFIEDLARFFAVLCKKKTIHRDLKGCNIFVLERGGFLLLDVEDILFTEVGEENLERMLIQLNTTIPKRISVGDRVRFYLKLIEDLKVDKKRVFRRVSGESLKSEIVYEGVSGLKRETWSPARAR
jgi:tRNA A-37 threonylcarbamoyl transferase component Bud32